MRRKHARFKPKGAPHRRPQRLETFLAYARDSYDTPLPRYVEEELRGYLRCGVFAHGFVRARCEALASPP